LLTSLPQTAHASTLSTAAAIGNGLSECFRFGWLALRSSPSPRRRPLPSECEFCGSDRGHLDAFSLFLHL
jgi:hypothetical protein